MPRATSKCNFALIQHCNFRHRQDERESIAVCYAAAMDESRSEEDDSHEVRLLVSNMRSFKRQIGSECNHPRVYMRMSQGPVEGSCTMNSEDRIYHCPTLYSLLARLTSLITSHMHDAHGRLDCVGWKRRLTNGESDKRRVRGAFLSGLPRLDALAFHSEFESQQPALGISTAFRCILRPHHSRPRTLPQQSLLHLTST